MPAWSSWNFRNSRGEDVEAWYWTPPGFDSTRTYPMVVHYYGGTLPMKKNFENRLLWFASNGYVVLFMNPAGTPGYGQKFANYHINDWGFPAATDIIEGTEQFSKTHRYVDPSRVGNFGHSYGGALVSQLAGSAGVKSLVYVAAFVPQAGETLSKTWLVVWMSCAADSNGRIGGWPSGSAQGNGQSHHLYEAPATNLAA